MNSSAGHALLSPPSAVPHRPPRLMYMHEKMIWPPSLKGEVTHEKKKRLKREARCSQGREALKQEQNNNKKERCHSTIKTKGEKKHHNSKRRHAAHIDLSQHTQREREEMHAHQSRVQLPRLTHREGEPKSTQAERGRGANNVSESKDKERARRHGGRREETAGRD